MSAAKPESQARQQRYQYLIKFKQGNKMLLTIQALIPILPPLTTPRRIKMERKDKKLLVRSELKVFLDQ